jgi:ornithine carbamoyltransferase
VQYNYQVGNVKSQPRKKKPKKVRDLVSITGLTQDLIYELFDFGLFLKQNTLIDNDGTEIFPLQGKTVSMIFEKPSLRTRVSFELGIYELGGYAVSLTGDNIGIGKRESVKDIAQLLSRYNDAIIARLYSHQMMEDLAKYATVPVINALTDLSHPCQVLTDAFTLYEKQLWHDGVKVVFVGDGNNVVNSWLELAGIMPMHFVLACPEGYEPDEKILKAAQKKGISTIEILHDPKKAVQNADVIYSDVWASMGQESEKDARMKAFEGFQVNADLLSHAKDSTRIMHCMPAKRGMEITDEVLDGPQSIILDEAENRLHLQKALLAKLLNRELYKDFGLTHRLYNAAHKFESQKA